MPSIALSQLLMRIALILLVSRYITKGDIKDAACLVYYVTSTFDLQINWKQ